MRFMWSLGRTYSDYYFFNYGKDSGLMFERLSVTLLKLENKLELNKNDKFNYLQLKDKLKKRMQEVLNPRFKPGDLVSIDGEKSVCTVLSNPVIDEKLGKIMVNVMVEGKVFPVENKSLRSVKRLSRNHA
jgi:hypothetical protein